MDWLREQGPRQGGQAVEREATEGAVEALVDGNVGVIVELNCNTDFVAKGTEFTATVVGASRSSSPPRATAMSPRCRSRAPRSARRSRSSPRKLGENVVARSRRALRGVRRPARRLHATSRTTGAPSACSSSSAASTRPNARCTASRARDLAARRVRRARRTSPATRCPADVVDRERAVIEAKSRNEGVPEAKLAGAVTGRLNAFYKDVVLLEQAFGEGPEGHDRQARRGSRCATPRCAASPREGRRGVASAPSWRSSRFRRVVLKLSGEAFENAATGHHIDAAVVAAHRRGDRAGTARSRRRDRRRRWVAATSGGECRATNRGMDRARSDYMGMLGTVINALALAGRARSGRPADARADRDHDGADRRAVHPAPRDPAPREGPGRRVRRRQRQPVLHDRHHRRAARGGDRRRGDPEGHALGRRRRLQRRPAESTPTR